MSPEPDYVDRALRIGVGGPVGTGKSSLVAGLCRRLASELRLAVVTNDIYTTEDALFRARAGADRRGPDGLCPHTAIRDDVSANLQAAEDLERAHGPLDLVFVESGGDNLTACFSPALADAQLFVLDCAGGDDVPRKGGPGVARADLLIVNKTDLAPDVGSDVELMLRDAADRRDGRPVLPVSVRAGDGLGAVADWIRAPRAAWTAGTLESEEPGPPAPHGPHDTLWRALHGRDADPDQAAAPVAAAWSLHG